MVISITAEKVAEMLALPLEDRAYMAPQLIASLEPALDKDVETEWDKVIERRSKEIAEGQVSCRPIEDTLSEIRAKLNARRQSS